MNERTQLILEMSETELRAVLVLLSGAHPDDFDGAAGRVLGLTREPAAQP